MSDVKYPLTNALVEDFESRVLSVVNCDAGYVDITVNKPGILCSTPDDLHGCNVITFDELSAISDPDDIDQKFATILDGYVNCRDWTRGLHLLWRIKPEFCTFWDDDKDGTIKNAGYCRLALVDKDGKKAEAHE